MLYSYVMVRTDIPLADQIVQVGHACMEAGKIFRPPSGNLIVLGVPSLEQLCTITACLAKLEIPYVTFAEPDEQMDFTATCTAPISGYQRRFFRSFPLWSTAESICQNHVPP